MRFTPGQMDPWLGCHLIRTGRGPVGALPARGGGGGGAGVRHCIMAVSIIQSGKMAWGAAALV